MCVTTAATQAHYVNSTAVSNNQKKPYTVHLCDMFQVTSICFLQNVLNMNIKTHNMDHKHTLMETWDINF
jgi:hypothetical protein